jgi:hypothetical protein
MMSELKIQWMEKARKRNADRQNLAERLRGVHKKHAAEIKRHALILKASAEALQELDKKIQEECRETAGSEDPNNTYTCGILVGNVDCPDLEEVVTLSRVLQEEVEQLARF